jgi:hypothetical protein
MVCAIGRYNYCSMEWKVECHGRGAQRRESMCPALPASERSGTTHPPINANTGANPDFEASPWHPHNTLAHTRHIRSLPSTERQDNAERKRIIPLGEQNRSRKKIAQRTPTPSSDTDFQSFSQSDISKNVTVTRMFGLPEATAPRRAHRHPIV